MKPLLKFEELRIKKAQLNEEASVPDLTDGQILQNRMKFSWMKRTKSMRAMEGWQAPGPTGSSPAIPDGCGRKM